MLERRVSIESVNASLRAQITYTEDRSRKDLQFSQAMILCTFWASLGSDCQPLISPGMYNCWSAETCLWTSSLMRSARAVECVFSRTSRWTMYTGPFAIVSSPSRVLWPILEYDAL